MNPHREREMTIMKNRVPEKKMYLAVLCFFDRVFDADLGNGICLS